MATIDKKDQTITEVEIHYIKTNNYRSIYINGLHGGFTPSGMLHVDLYSDRAPIPQKIIHEVEESGKLGPEKQREGKQGIIREIESGLIMDINTARSVRDWLNKKLKDYDKFFGKLDDKNVSNHKYSEE